MSGPRKQIKKVLTLIILGFFVLSTAIPAQAQVAWMLPPAGTMLSTSSSYLAPFLKGMIVYPDKPFNFDFIVDSGNSGLEGEALRSETQKLIRYFLASLTIPEDDMWVNLSPNERNRITSEELGRTEMGRDLLALDYILKQLTTSLITPESGPGAEMWKRIYSKAQELYGTTDIPIKTFNKIWITPDKAVVYQNDNVAIVLKSHLKVMMEEDFLASGKEQTSSNNGQEELNEQSLEIIREVIIPEIEKEVNQGENFALLRQVYQSMILATWYKKQLKGSILNQIYSDKYKTVGVKHQDEGIIEEIYDQYLKAFREGAYNFIKEDYDPISQENIPRKYFSGGLRMAVDLKTVGRGYSPSAQEIAPIDPAARFSMSSVELRAVDPQGLERLRKKVEEEARDRLTGDLVVGDYSDAQMLEQFADGFVGEGWAEEVELDAENVDHLRQLLPPGVEFDASQGILVIRIKESAIDENPFLKDLRDNFFNDEGERIKAVNFPASAKAPERWRGKGLIVAFEDEWNNNEIIRQHEVIELGLVMSNEGMSWAEAHDVTVNIMLLGDEIDREALDQYKGTVGAGIFGDWKKKKEEAKKEQERILAEIKASIEGISERHKVAVAAETARVLDGYEEEAARLKENIEAERQRKQSEDEARREAGAAAARNFQIPFHLDLFAVLGVDPKASRGQLRAAYEEKKSNPGEVSDELLEKAYAILIVNTTAKLQYKMVFGRVSNDTRTFLLNGGNLQEVPTFLQILADKIEELYDNAMTVKVSFLDRFERTPQFLKSENKRRQEALASFRRYLKDLASGHDSFNQNVTGRQMAEATIFSDRKFYPRIYDNFRDRVVALLNSMGRVSAVEVLEIARNVASEESQALGAQGAEKAGVEEFEEYFARVKARDRNSPLIRPGKGQSAKGAALQVAIAHDYGDEFIGLYTQFLALLDPIPRGGDLVQIANAGDRIVRENQPGFSDDGIKDFEIFVKGLGSETHEFYQRRDATPIQTVRENALQYGFGTAYEGLLLELFQRLVELGRFSQGTLIIEAEDILAAHRPEGSAQAGLGDGESGQDSPEAVKRQGMQEFQRYMKMVSSNETDLVRAETPQAAAVSVARKHGFGKGFEDLYIQLDKLFNGLAQRNSFPAVFIANARARIERENQPGFSDNGTEDFQDYLAGLKEGRMSFGQHGDRSETSRYLALSYGLGTACEVLLQELYGRLSRFSRFTAQTVLREAEKVLRTHGVEPEDRSRKAEDYAAVFQSLSEAERAQGVREFNEFIELVDDRGNNASFIVDISGEEMSRRLRGRSYGQGFALLYDQTVAVYNRGYLARGIINGASVRIARRVLREARGEIVTGADEFAEFIDMLRSNRPPKIIRSTGVAAAYTYGFSEKFMPYYEDFLNQIQGVSYTSQRDLYGKLADIASRILGTYGDGGGETFGGTGASVGRNQSGDLYGVLGVSRGDSADDLKRAYRKAAKECHPDINPENATAEEQFKRVSAAYEILGDEDLRRIYDQRGIEAALAHQRQRMQQGRPDRGMLGEQEVKSDQAELSQVGGIDLSGNNLDLDIQGDIGEFMIPINVDAVKMEDFNLEGLFPVIFTITPLPSLSPLLGQETSQNQIPSV